MSNKRILQAIVGMVGLPFLLFFLFYVGRYVFTGHTVEGGAGRCLAAVFIAFISFAFIGLSEI